MASISVPCPKCSLRAAPAPAPRPRPPLHAGSVRLPRVHAPSRSRSLILNAKVQEVAVENTSNSSPLPKSKSESQPSDVKDAKIVENSSPKAAIPDSMISAFMAEVSDLVKLVDTRDIVELQLKQKDCEVLIRKKEALPQPAFPVVMMQPPPQAMLPPHAPLAHAAPTPAPSSPPPSAPAPALPPPAKASSSSLPSLKCPMAGTFYRCPAPGEPPFVKVGDKVQKGQVVCIIEAMKLMNEIEADQSGTIIEILAEDAKPVSVDIPLLIIQP